MSSQFTTAFYAVDSDRPIRAYSDSWLQGWSALSAALADNYGADAESFYTSEAYWNGDREYAELVMLDGEIVGAVNRPISKADVAAMGRVRLQKRAFINRIRSLFNIDSYALPELTREQQSAFLRDPLQYFLKTDEAQSDAIMREVENRQKGEASDPAVREQRLARELEADAELKVAKKPATVKAPRAKKAKPKVEGQTEMLLPIPGGKTRERKPAQATTSGRKAG